MSSTIPTSTMLPSSLTSTQLFAIETSRDSTQGSTTATVPLLAARRSCCFNNYRCKNLPRWKIDDGYFCAQHAETWWGSHFVHQHRVTRL